MAAAAMKYSGNFVDGVFHGSGIMTTAERNYKGQWCSGQRHGEGILEVCTADGEFVSRYSGGWANDKKDGKGVFEKVTCTCILCASQRNDIHSCV